MASEHCISDPQAMIHALHCHREKEEKHDSQKPHMPFLFQGPDNELRRVGLCGTIAPCSGHEHYRSQTYMQAR